MNWILNTIVAAAMVFSNSSVVIANTNILTSKPVRMKIPGNVLNISKDNTYPNPAQDLQTLEPSPLTEKLIESAGIPIDNPELIKILNECSIKNAPLAVGYRAKIYLGTWPLVYKSQETSVNWEYQRVNTNYLDNRGGKQTRQMSYYQEMQRTVKGGLTAHIEHSEEIKKMIMLHAKNSTGLPIGFETIVGAGTKNHQVYNVPANMLGYLYTYVPAVNERGKVTFGEVYLVLKGNQKKLVIRNVTSQGIGAWIPIQEHLSFSYLHSNRPR